MGMSYLNTGGLQDGMIPAGHVCPFLKECLLKSDSCPTSETLKKKDYSCAAARMHALLLQTESPLMRSLVKKTSKT